MGSCMRGLGEAGEAHGQHAGWVMQACTHELVAQCHAHVLADPGELRGVMHLGWLM